MNRRSIIPRAAVAALPARQETAPSRRRTLGLLGALALCSLSPFAVAQSGDAFPGRPVRIVLPYAPGGISDAVTRLIAQHLSVRLGQSVIVENRPGGNGVIGTSEVVNAAPDGYTLLMVPAALVTNPYLMKKPCLSGCLPSPLPIVCWASVPTRGNHGY